MRTSHNPTARPALGFHRVIPTIHIEMTNLLLIFEGCPKMNNSLQTMPLIEFASVIIIYYYISPFVYKHQ